MLSSEHLRLVAYGIIYHTVLVIFAIHNAGTIRDVWPTTICISTGAMLLAYLTKTATKKICPTENTAVVNAINSIACILPLFYMLYSGSSDENGIITMTFTMYAISIMLLQTTNTDSSKVTQSILYTVGAVFGSVATLIVSEIVGLATLPIWWPIVPVVCMLGLQFRHTSNPMIQNSPYTANCSFTWEHTLRAGLSTTTLILVGVWLANTAHPDNNIWVTMLSTFVIGAALGRIIGSRSHAFLANGLPVTMLIMVFLDTLNTRQYVEFVYISVFAMVSLLLIVWTLNSLKQDGDKRWSRILGSFIGATLGVAAVKFELSHLSVLITLFPMITYLTLRQLLESDSTRNNITRFDILIVAMFGLYTVGNHMILPSGHQWIPMITQFQTISNTWLKSINIPLPTYNMIDIFTENILPSFLCFLTSHRPGRFACCLAILIVYFMTLS